MIGLRLIASTAEAAEGAHETFKPTDEFEHAVKPISIAGHELAFHIGPIDMSVSKAVVYVWLAALIVGILCITIARIAKVLPTRKQMALETLYEFVEDKLVGAVMHGKAAATWFPYILTLFLFILVSNLIGLLPFFLGTEEWKGVTLPALGTFAATSNINVTVALALMTFVFTHFAGIRANGPIGYFVGWVPSSAPAVLKPVLFLIHFVSEIFRLVSLAVRLFANLLAGHIMILVFYSLTFMLSSYVLLVLLIPLEFGVIAISLFEIFVAVIQAYIFAILSAVYIGGAIDQDH
ncbi:MAG: F0F1 ATP synthase subunit A [Thermoleophilia bacterium]|nr:F0F1 ATP synthase subunit A [Thermoleophilia bacterium]